MKRTILILILLISTVSFSQKKVVEKKQINANEISIYTEGLDNLVVENSNSGFLEVYLQAESYDEQFIEIEENSSEANIKFNFKGTETREVIFRKFITKRLQRAHAIVKVPQGKKVTIFGEDVDVETKSFKNNLAVYIENGIIKLNKIKANVMLKLYSGNVYASIQNSNIDIASSNGKIKVDSIFYQKKHQKKSLENKNELKVITIKANIFLTTK